MFDKIYTEKRKKNPSRSSSISFTESIWPKPHFYNVLFIYIYI